MQHIRHSLDGVAADLLKGLPEEDRVLAAWPHACGKAVAAKARAASYGGGVLRVAVADKEWSELASLAPQYVTRLRQLTGVAVNQIFFEVQRTNF